MNTDCVSSCVKIYYGCFTEKRNMKRVMQKKEFDMVLPHLEGQVGDKLI